MVLQMAIHGFKSSQFPSKNDQKSPKIGGFYQECCVVIVTIFLVYPPIIGDFWPFLREINNLATFEAKIPNLAGALVLKIAKLAISTFNLPISGSAYQKSE